MKLKSFIVASVCVMVQYYDYHLFGLLAAKLSDNFFGSDPENNISALSKTYLIISLGYLAKPFGSILLGRMGDIYGRFSTILLSLGGTAFASLIISIVPSYEKIGILSAIILLLCRLIVSGVVSTGADGVRIYIFEHIGDKRQCLGNGLITSFAQGGAFIASLSAGFFTSQHFPDYGWRIAFLVGTIMGIFAIILRLSTSSDDVDYLKKDPKYEYYKDKKTYKIAFNHKILFVASALMLGSIGASNQFMIIWLGTYFFKTLAIVPQDVMKSIISFGIFLNIIFSIIGGYLADKYSKIFIINLAGTICLCFSVYLMYSTSLDQFSKISYYMICSFAPFLTMPALVLFKQSIPQVIRYRIFSLSHAIGSIVISGTTAFICNSLYSIFKINWLPFIYLLFIILCIIIVCNYLVKIKDSNL